MVGCDYMASILNQTFSRAFFIMVVVVVGINNVVVVVAVVAVVDSVVADFKHEL